MFDAARLVHNIHQRAEKKGKPSDIRTDNPSAKINSACASVGVDYAELFGAEADVVLRWEQVHSAVVPTKGGPNKRMSCFVFILHIAKSSYNTSDCECECI